MVLCSVFFSFTHQGWLCQYHSWCVNENTQNTAPSYCLSTALLVVCQKTVFSCGSNCSSILILLHFIVMRCLFYFLVLSFRALCPSLKSVLLFAIIACFLLCTCHRSCFGDSATIHFVFSLPSEHLCWTLVYSTVMYIGLLLIYSSLNIGAIFDF